MGDDVSLGSRGEKKKRRRRRKSIEVSIINDTEGVFRCSNEVGGPDDGFESDWVDENDGEEETPDQDRQIINDVDIALMKAVEVEATKGVSNVAGLNLEGFESVVGDTVEEELVQKESK